MTAKRKLLIDCLHVFVLTNFALAQPLLYRLSRKTVFLEDHGIERVTLFALVVLLCLAAPTLIWAIEVGAGWMSERARERAHEVTVFVLMTAISGRSWDY